jgi:hypothetical protein
MKNTKNALTKKDLKFASHKLGQALGDLYTPNTTMNSAGQLQKLKTVLDVAKSGDEQATRKVHKHGADIVSDIKNKVTYAVEEQQRWSDEAPSHVETEGSNDALHHLQRAHEKLSKTESTLKDKTKH